jgi:glycogen debranching enzyme
MLTSLERPDRAEFWRKKAAALRENANRRLWQEDKGFYRVHIHLEPWPHDFDEDNMFPMGGNAQAVISGLADPNQARRIIEQALRRQKEYGVSTISGVLLPPYPSGFFKHPAMDDPFEYQNGGQWDWFGGRLVLAMFENGFSRTAREKLIEIIRKNVANGGLFEWDTREGAGRGSDYYAGSAGSLARALFEGYFGLKFGEGRLDLEPRLGEDRGRVHLYLPMAGHYAAYDYAPFGDKKKIVIRYSSSFPGQGTIKVLIPWTFFGIEDRESGKNLLEISRDGAPVKFEWQTLHEDDFIIAGTDFRDHTLEIKRLEK